MSRDKIVCRTLEWCNPHIPDDLINAAGEYEVLYHNVCQVCFTEVVLYEIGEEGIVLFEMRQNIIISKARSRYNKEIRVGRD